MATEHSLREGVSLQSSFFDTAVSERARLFCSSAMSRLEVELNMRELAPTRAGHVVLFARQTLSQCMQWLNEKIVLKNIGREKITLQDMYRFLSVFICSHCTGFSFLCLLTSSSQMAVQPRRLRPSDLLVQTSQLTLRLAATTSWSS